MENFPGFVPESDDDDEESKAEKRTKKDAKEIVKKASWLEMFGAEKVEKTEKKHVEKAEQNEDSKEDTPEEIAELDIEEEQIASEQLVDDRLEQTSVELEEAEDGSSEEIEAVAAATFLEKVGAKLEQGQMLSQEVLAEAAAETTEALGIEPSEPEEMVEPAIAEAEVNPASDSEIIDEEDIPTLPVPTIRGAGSSGGGTVPPAGAIPTPTLSGPPAGRPSPSSSAAGSAFATGYQGPAGLSPPNLNVLPTTPNVQPSQPEGKHGHAKYVLAGGLLGYLIGRRRGRIKTEARLLPVQERLENRIAKMNNQLLEQEESIRRTAILHRERLTNVDRNETKEVVRKEREKRANTLKIYESVIQKKPEAIGKFALLPEAKLVLPNNQESLGDKKLIEIAKQMPVHGSSLESLYKAGRVELKDLKEIVAAYINGKSYERLLAKAIKPGQQEGGLSGGGANLQIESPKLDQLTSKLPELPGVKKEEALRFESRKQTNMVARFGIVAGTVATVVTAAVIITLLLLEAM